jgi:hypothetical protein
MRCVPAILLTSCAYTSRGTPRACLQSHRRISAGLLQGLLQLMPGLAVVHAVVGGQSIALCTNRYAAAYWEQHHESSSSTTPSPAAKQMSRHAVLIEAVAHEQGITVVWLPNWQWYWLRYKPRGDESDADSAGAAGGHWSAGSGESDGSAGAGSRHGTRSRAATGSGDTAGGHWGADSGDSDAESWWHAGAGGHWGADGDDPDGETRAATQPGGVGSDHESDMEAWWHTGADGDSDEHDSEHVLSHDDELEHSSSQDLIAEHDGRQRGWEQPEESDAVAQVSAECGESPRPQLPTTYKDAMRTEVLAHVCSDVRTALQPFLQQEQ